MKSSPKAAFLWLIKTIPGVTDEYQFAKPRKFRFDHALVEQKIGIEYDGIISAKSRHTSISGFTRDCEKTNLAAVNGWRVLRYTALNYHQVKTDLDQILKGCNSLNLNDHLIRQVEVPPKTKRAVNHE